MSEQTGKNEALKKNVEAAYKEHFKNISETRTLRCIVGKAGGNAGTASLNYKISIPSAWAAALGVSPGNRELKVTFDGEKITIEKF